MKLNRRSKVRPLGQRILVKPLKDDETFGTGVIVKPQIAENKPVIGKVVAIGDGHQDTNFTGEWPPLDMGQIVLYGRYAGVEIATEDEKEAEWARMVSIDEILGVVEKV